MVLVQKWHFFNFFFFRQYRLGKCVLRYSRMKNAFLGFKKGSSKSPKIAISANGKKTEPICFGPKVAIFSTCFFSAKQGSKMSFRIFWNEKTHCQGIKTGSSKSRKVAIFVKGLTHGFGTKMAIFAASFFFGKIGQENVFFDILQRKKRLSWL